MDHLSFAFSLLLIVLVTTTTFGSAIKANNPNGEVKKRIDLSHYFWSNFLFALLNGVSLSKFSWHLRSFLLHEWTSNSRHQHEKCKSTWKALTNRSANQNVAFHAETGAYVDTFARKIKPKRPQFHWNTLRLHVKGFYLYFYTLWSESSFLSSLEDSSIPSGNKRWNGHVLSVAIMVFNAYLKTFRRNKTSQICPHPLSC